MERIIITGANSFLGRNLVMKFLDEGYEVYALVRNVESFEKEMENKERLHSIIWNLENPETVLDTVKAGDYFFHFAWDGSGNIGRSDERIQLRNIDLSLKVVEVALKLGCKKFFFPGSQAEYGKRTDEMKEDDELFPISPYGKAKMLFSRQAQKMMAGCPIDYVHLRIFSVYGYGDREGTLVNECIRKFSTGETVQLGPCVQKWNYLYIDDFNNIMVELLRGDCKTGIYNIASDDTRVLREYVEDIDRCAGNTGKYVFGDLEYNPEKSPALQPSIDRMLRVIGTYSFTAFEDGIRMTMKKMKM